VQLVRFGLSLDGERGWPARDALGESTVGPLGFLTLIEIQLGLTRLAVSESERVVQWRACLSACRTGSRFYERSFQTDELGTAATLLHWRDTWIEHGWRGATPTGATRLADLAAVETATRGKLAPCLGERLREVAAMLPQRPVQIEVVELLDPLEDFSHAWRAVFSRLPCVKPPVSEAAVCGADGSFLRALQEHLRALGKGGRPEKLPWREDGSVRIVRAETGLAAAEWVAAEIQRRPQDDRLIVSEHDGALVDAAAMAFDQPLQGLSDPSAFRPSLQVLPLALRLIWDPLDFRALMQFLTHPIGPLPRYARSRLAQKIASTPGLGGTSWSRALSEIHAHYGNRGPQVVRDIALWLEHPRFPTAQRAPLSAVVDRARRLAEFFQQRLVDEDDIRRVGAVAGFRQCQAVQHSLELLIEQHEERIGPEALDKLVSQSTAAGTDNPLMRAQAGAGGQVKDPAAAIEPFDDVLWWSMRAVPLIPAYPWSRSEREALSTVGVELPDIARLLERQARGWCCPILQARKHLTLILPAEGEELHPMWLTLAAILDRPVIESVESVLQSAAPTQGIAEVPCRPLPARRRWWQVPRGAIRGWQKYDASYSSLQSFIYNPYQWALSYPGQLKASALLTLPSDSQLYGSLAHRAVERLYRQPEALGWSVEQVRAWFDATLDGILIEEGAVLFMPGRSADREALRQRVRRALGELHRHLQAAGAQRVEPEKALKADTPLGTLAGDTDLLVSLAGNDQVVVDMKWSGTRWHRDHLKSQSHIQLAIYARMVERNTSNWPAVAYFILRDAQLLPTTAGVFPGTSPVIVPGSSTALVWAKLETTWRWRREQIEAGDLELALEDVEPTPESVPPAQALTMEPSNERFNPFVYLAGWGADA
jgi:hypothetical protein